MLISNKQVKLHPPKLPKQRPKGDLALAVGTLAPELDQEQQLLVLPLRQAVLTNVLALNLYLVDINKLGMAGWVTNHITLSN